ncbi:MAG: ROK family protein [Microbacteriaceae bacterium]|nr:ROK family protein [Microbacteriaceae bacterium]
MPAVKPWVASIDIGGTWTRFAAVTIDGEVRGRERFATGAESSPDMVRARWRDRWAALIEREGSGGPPVAVGIGATGPVERDSGRLLEVPNAGPGLQGAELVAEFRMLSGVPVVLERDTCAALLAEAHAGAGAGCSELVYVTVSTGVGGAVLSDSRLVLGRAGGAGEIGHVIADPAGPLCGCGRTGCLEAIASGPAIAAAATRMLGEPAAGRLRELLGEGEPTGLRVSEAAAVGDPVAIAILATARDALARSIVDLANTFDPERIVVGGSVAEGNPGWIPVLQHAVREQALRPTRDALSVVPAALGDDAVLLGAARLAWEESGIASGMP